MGVEDTEMRLLRIINERAAAFADVWITSNDVNIVGASTYRFLLELLGDLKKRDLITLGRGKKLRGVIHLPVRLTVTGVRHLEQLECELKKAKRAFVAMWFNEEMNDAYNDGILTGLRDCGFEPIRIDRVEHNEKICDAILGQIRDATVIVADFTGARHGVYFEAGFALALGKPVVWTCRQDWFDRVHFDTRQYNHIVWADTTELRRRLRDRIRETVALPG